MKVWKKLSAVALALVMVMALCVPAFASESVPTELDTGSTDATLKGQAGTFTDTDNPQSQEKKLNLKKEITAYNVNEATINAPTISYTYTIASAIPPANATVTDLASKHKSAKSVKVPVYAGVGTPVIASEGVVAWATTDTLNADNDGVANYKDITIDFSDVVFDAPGVYRYVITEALTTSSDTYTTYAVTETATTDNTNNEVHKRYVDVYVRAADGYTNGALAADWDIYGYTCFYKNQSITDTDKGSGAVKTIGFVAGTTDGSIALSADSYYTYNVTVSKVVKNDNFAKSHAFPFTVIFTNSAVKKDVAIKTSISKVDEEDTATAEATGFIANNSATNLISGTFTDTNAFEGLLNIKHNTAVKYIGIPCGTKVEVYETNDVTGATYSVATVVDGTTDPSNDESDDAVISGTTPDSAVTQGTKQDYQSTSVTFTPPINTNDTTDHSIAITNTLLNISPTGVTLRYAPYMAMMGLGVVALPLSLRKKEELD
ncbi:MAG: hypothetical protein IKO14_10540 [Oscillibacter sp.]|nr:hypothetical protein [Oscillibacter sp.]